MIWKLRTMKTSVDVQLHQRHVTQLMSTDGPLQKFDHDAHVIPLGKTLRRWGIDELPQFLNVLRGEMSLVGPRPDVVPIDAYQPWQRLRFNVRPGMTGPWQVQGKNRTSFREMMRLDVDYATHHSLWLDTRILLLTVPSILQQSADEHD